MTLATTLIAAQHPRIRVRHRHGFDMSKLVPSSLFYLPCQAKHPSGSFFLDHGEAPRAPLDPFAWAGYAANRARPPRPEPARDEAQADAQADARLSGGPEPAVIPVSTSPAKRAYIERRLVEQGQNFAAERARRCEEAVGAWRQSPAGSGHEAFFRLALGLARAGLPLPEVMATLYHEASFARHPEERRREVAGIMRSLTKHCRARAA